MALVCAHCGNPGGCLRWEDGPAVGDGGPPARRQQQPAQGRNGGQPRGKSGRRPANPDAPMCLECGERRVNQRHDGTWFETCIRCG